MAEMAPGLAGVVLAAGESRRLGQPKQLVKLAGRPLVWHAAVRARAVCALGVTVITGAGGEAVGAALAGAGVRVVHNPHWVSGMASSLRLALEKLEKLECRGVLLMVCDQPAVTAEHLAGLASLWLSAPDTPVAARYRGAAGVPAILPRGWLGRVSELQGDEGARGLLRDSEEKPRLLDMPEAALDVDTPDDLKQLLQIANRL